MRMTVHLTCAANAKSAPLSKCQVCPTLGLVVGRQTWGLLGSFCFSGETSKGANDRFSGEHDQRASDPKKTEVR